MLPEALHSIVMKYEISSQVRNEQRLHSAYLCDRSALRLGKVRIARLQLDTLHLLGMMSL